ncbi:MAG: GntR family transcriptional regulator [Solirubrobacteraceae bacterium]|nr:GntR family transcriptional regulator [Solirubrobacteraceae bacterium]
MSAAPSRAERVYHEIRDRLLRGEFPVGQRLVELQLSAEHGTSRTPVREALRRLEGDGHLERDPSGGLRPAVPSVRQMRELYDVRVAIEELVVRRAAAGGDKAVLEQLSSDWAALSTAWHDGRAELHGPDFVHADEDFHQRIAAASGHETAERLLGDLNDRIRILRIHDFTSEERIRATLAEHAEIIEAVLAEEPEASAAFMRSHVLRSALVVRERVGVALARMFELPDAAEPTDG